MNSDILRAAEESQGEKVSNNYYRPSVCSVLREVVAEVAMVVAFQSPGLSKRGRSMHGRRYGGALQVEKKYERGKGKKYGSSIVSRCGTRNVSGENEEKRRTPCSPPRTCMPGEFSRALECTAASQACI
jgi:hypothetical protein